MENILSALAPRDARSGLVNVVIDTPQGSRNKFKYDETLGCFRLSRILPAGYSFPYDFGSIPQTRVEDGDALDVLVLNDAPSFPGCLVTVRLIGVIAARQTAKRKTIRNDRLIAVPQTPVNRPRIRDLKELHPQALREMEHFFVGYNLAQGRRFEATGRLGPRKADQILESAIAKFLED
jgi:inorganic pyrophosphatase